MIWIGFFVPCEKPDKLLRCQEIAFPLLQFRKFSRGGPRDTLRWWLAPLHIQNAGFGLRVWHRRIWEKNLHENHHFSLVHTVWFKYKPFFMVHYGGNINFHLQYILYGWDTNSSLYFILYGWDMNTFSRFILYGADINFYLWIITYSSDMNPFLWFILYGSNINPT